MSFSYPNLELIYNYLDIKELNPMQIASIEAYRTQDKITLLSPTGSGKTLAFLLPIIERLDKENKNTQALIIAPSRELAQQIEQVFRSLRTGFKITNCYGGHKREIEENNLIQPPAIIVGTPGRLCDHIRRGNITLDSITMLALDEFDKTLEAGFQDEVGFIIDNLKHIEKRMLTSATHALELPDFIEMQDATMIDFLPENEVKKALEIKSVYAKDDEDKVDTLFKLICHLGNRPTIVFCNQRDSVEIISDMLREKGIPSEFYHGQMEQRDRDTALFKFRNGTVNLLITTDLAARGLDIPFIRYIIHYNLPYTEDSFIHRNGRTARMDASGTAILMFSKGDYMPPFIPTEEVEKIELEERYDIPDKPKWVTLYMPLGKKNKISKGDIAGFMINQAELRPEDLGLIEVKDFSSFIAVRRTKAAHILSATKEARIKNKKAKLEFAK